MHKNTLWFIFAILCIYFSVILCESPAETEALQLDLSQNSAARSFRGQAKDITALQEHEEGRIRRHRHRFHHLWVWPAIAAAYIVKVKVVIVAFFLGSAVFLGLRYFWPHKCGGGIGGIYKESPIIYDHPPPSFSDHIPYSFGPSEHYDHHDHHHFDISSFSDSSPSSSFEPYSAYAGAYEVSSDSGPPTASTGSAPPTFRKKRDTTKETKEEESVATVEENHADIDEEQPAEARAAKPVRPAAEEQIGDFMLTFLGLDSRACRQRFICEMEFRSRLNPLTAMAFRVVGRSFFGKYTNSHNELGRAKNFDECAAVNPECVFIENDDPENQEDTEETTDEHEEDEEAAAASLESANDLKLELSTDKASTENSAVENNEVTKDDEEQREKQNKKNLKAELRRNSYRRWLEAQENRMQ